MDGGREIGREGEVIGFEVCVQLRYMGSVREGLCL